MSEEDLDIEGREQGAVASRSAAVHTPESAVRALSPLNIDHGFTFSAEFTARKRSLAQIYETIQRYLTGTRRHSDAYYPSGDDVYEDLLVYKRAISDRVPMPTRVQLDEELLLLALQSPPFIHVLRELDCDASGRLGVVTRYSAPTEKHPDKVQVSYQAVARNCGEAFKDFVSRNKEQLPWEMELVRTQAAEEPDVRPGRIDRLLRMLFVAGNAAVGESAVALRRVNQDIQRRIILPCLQQLLRDGAIVSISCKDVRGSSVPGAERFTDLVLVADDDSLERRFRIVSAMIESPRAKSFLDSPAFVEALNAKEKGELSEHHYSARLGRLLLDRASSEGAQTSIPEGLLGAAVEAMKLGERRHDTEQVKQKEAELEAVRSILKRLEEQGSVYRARHGEKALVPDHYLRLALAGRLPGVLACTDPFVDFRGRSVPASLSQFTSVFLLLRDRRVVGAAIDAALDVFAKTEDPFLLFVLENILGLGLRAEKEWKEYAPPLHVERLRAALRSAYSRHLAWWQRAWNFVTSSEIGDERMAALRERRRAQAAARVEASGARQEKAGAVSARREIKRVARERVDRAGPLSEHRAGKPEGAEERQAQEAVLEVLSGLWDRGEFPGRKDVLERIRADLRDSVAGLLDLAEVGAASARPIVAIVIPNSDPVFADEAFLKAKRASLVDALSRRAGGQEDIVIDNVTMTRKRTVRDADTLRAVLDYVRGLS